MLGWVAATNKFGIEPGVLFMIQFFWQFPHFWAIAWVRYSDYKKAGIQLLPSGKKDHKTTITYKKIEQNIPIKENFFSSQNMKKRNLKR